MARLVRKRVPGVAAFAVTVIALNACGTNPTVGNTTYYNVTTTPTQMNFSAIGASNAQTVVVSQMNNSFGFFSFLTDGCGGIATVAVAPPPTPTPTGSGSSLPITYEWFTVTPVGAGKCGVDFYGDGQVETAATLLISVTTGGSSARPSATPSATPGVFIVSPTAVTVNTQGGGTNTATLTVSEANYTSAFNVNASACTGGSYATVSPASANGPSATFTISGGTTPTLATPCAMVFTDTRGGSITVNVTVNP